MHRTLVAILMCLASAAAFAAPAQPRYEPPEPVRPMPLFVFAGSHWTGKCYADDFWIIFKMDGSLNYGYKTGDGTSNFRNGSWQLEGDKLYFEMNNKYLEFRGTMNGQVIEGDAWNVAGGRWKTHFSLSNLKK